MNIGECMKYNFETFLFDALVMVVIVVILQTVKALVVLQSIDFTKVLAH